MARAVLKGGLGVADDPGRVGFVVLQAEGHRAEPVGGGSGVGGGVGVFCVVVVIVVVVVVVGGGSGCYC